MIRGESIRGGTNEKGAFERGGENSSSLAMWCYICGAKQVAETKTLLKRCYDGTLNGSFLTKNGKEVTTASYATGSLLMRAASQCFVPTVGSTRLPAARLIALLLAQNTRN